MSLKPLSITVLSDIHHYSVKSGTSGKAYDTANAKSQKLLAESGEVLKAAFDKIAADDTSDIVIISGDITNNGELTAHNEVIEMMNDLKSKCKKVFVITATHDYRDGGFTDAYDGDEKIPTPAASREMLFDMYRSFGPDEAVSVHRDSMSYVVQLCEGYRLFALNDDRNHSGKSGFSDECFEWISKQAEDARKNNQFIIAMTHHPLIAPSPIYELIGKGDMLGDYDKRLYELADIGVQFIFTGHTHIHNISYDQSERNNLIYDVCTASPVGYPGTYRKVTFRPEDNKVDVITEYVPNPESFKNSGRNVMDVFENQLIGTIKGMIKTAGEDIDKLADMATAISIKPKVIYKFGWIIKPVFKFLNSLKVSTVAKWTKKETGLKPADYAEIKNKKVVDVITELVLNLFGGESKYPPHTPTYKITVGLLKIIDSILNVLHIDLKKILKVAPDTVGLVESLLYNPVIDAYNVSLNIYPYIEAGDKGEKVPTPQKEITVKDSKKGLPILISAVLILLAFLPIWLLLILFAFVKNQIKYGKKFK